MEKPRSESGNSTLRLSTETIDNLASGRLAPSASSAPLINLAENFVDTMAILEYLDRLVAVDTSLAHLAGALGRLVSILPFAPDLR